MNHQKWLLWDLNPRPFGIAPKATALDRSAKQPYYLFAIRHPQIFKFQI